MAVPLVVIFIQLGIYFRRRKSHLRYPFFFLSVVTLVGMVAWIVYRGDLNSGRWIKIFFSGE